MALQTDLGRVKIAKTNGKSWDQDQSDENFTPLSLWKALPEKQKHSDPSSKQLPV